MGRREGRKDFNNSVRGEFEMPIVEASRRLPDDQNLLHGEQAICDMRPANAVLNSDQEGQGFDIQMPPFSGETRFNLRH